jgi:LEA14-like dessication related protein
MEYMSKKILLVSMIAFMTLSSCKIREVEIGKFDGISLKNIGKKNATIELMIPIKNTNSFGFTISKIKMNLTLNDKDIGKIEKVSRLHIPANSSQTYPIDFDVDLDKTAGNISSLALGLLKNRMGIKADGFVKVRKFIFAKKFPVNQNEAIKLF